MPTLNRKTTPRFREIEKIDIIRAEKTVLGNNIPVYSINAGTQDVIRVELLFHAGSWHQPAPSIASATSHLMSEGTSQMTAQQIARQLDYYGAYLNPYSDKDIACISLYTLNKFLPETLQVLEQIVKDAAYPQYELDIFIQTQLQKFHIDNEKVQLLARKYFNTVLFGTKHPYGVFLREEHIKKIKRTDLSEFHRKWYASGNCTIILSGNVSQDTLSLINRYFGGQDWKQDFTNGIAKEYQLSPDPVKKHHIPKADTVQSAIRIGKTVINKHHNDYPALQILNTVLGGYFGSRLMSNIREDKGYTYGIGSAVVSMQQGGSFFIATETGSDVTAKALHEIFLEMERLRKEPVPPDELQKVKNYLMGEFLRSADGPFSLAEMLKGILFYGLDYSYFDRFVNTIKTANPDLLLELAQKYLDPDEMYEVVAGGS